MAAFLVSHLHQPLLPFPSGMLSAAQNTRRWPRYPVDIPLSIVRNRDVAHHAISARGVEISRRGMAIATELTFAPDEIIKVDFCAAVPLSIKAIVRNQSSARVGVEFLHCQWAERDPAYDPRELRSVEQALTRKQLQMERIQHEIRALSHTIRLLEIPPEQ